MSKYSETLKQMVLTAKFNKNLVLCIHMRGLQGLRYSFEICTVNEKAYATVTDAILENGNGYPFFETKLKWSQNHGNKINPCTICAANDPSWGWERIFHNPEAQKFMVIA